MFPDDMNLLYSNKNIKTLFRIANSEVKLVKEWFLANKLSQNPKKKKGLFHKLSKCDSLPLELPTMTINNIKIKRESFIKFPGVMIDESLIFKNYIKLLENNISKNT